jgi:hypothetical protein
MVYKIVTSPSAGDAQHVGGLDWNKINNYLSGTDTTDPAIINTTTTFRDSKLLIRNPANTFSYTIAAAAIANSRTLTLPLSVGNESLVGTNTAQTLLSKSLTAPVQTSYEDFTRTTIPANPATDFGRVYVKQIDTNNDGLFVLIKKNGVYTEVQVG